MLKVTYDSRDAKLVNAKLSQGRAGTSKSGRLDLPGTRERKENGSGMVEKCPLGLPSFGLGEEYSHLPIESGGSCTPSKDCIAHHVSPICRGRTQGRRV